MLSRVADSLYWLSRYMERMENNARILDVNLTLMLDLENPTPEQMRQHWASIVNSLEEQELFDTLYTETTAETVVDFVTFSRKNPNSIISCLASARENARTVREHISSEMWEQINRLYLFLTTGEAQQAFASSAYEFFKRMAEGSQLFQGITHSTLTHGEGFQFIQLGKYVERADCTTRILDVKYHILLPSGEEVGGTVDVVQWMAVLKSCSALEAYRKLYVGEIKPWTVAEFLILHDRFPRSIRFCVDNLDQSLHRISGCDRSHFSIEAERLSGRLCSSLDYATISDIMQYGLHEYLDEIQLKLIEVSSAMHREYCEWLPSDVSEQVATQ